MSYFLNQEFMYHLTIKSVDKGITENTKRKELTEDTSAFAIYDLMSACPVCLKIS